MPSRLRIFRLGDTYGGLNSQLAPHVLPNNVATLTNNWVIRTEGLETAKGWEQFTSQVLTDGEASPSNSSTFLIDEFFRNDGTSELLAFTDGAVYRFDESSDLWIPISPGAPQNTFVSIDSNSGQPTLSIDSLAGYSVGDTIIINEDGAREEEGVIDVVTSAGTIVASDNIEFEDNSEEELDGTTYTLLKSITITSAVTGTQRFTFDLKSKNNNATAFGKIYRNGGAIGTEQTVLGKTYANKSEDIAQVWAADDTLELWVKSDNASPSAAAIVRNFQMKFDGLTASFDLLDNLTYTHTLAQADVVRRTYAAAVVDANSLSAQKVLNVSHTDQFSVGEAIVIGPNTLGEEYGVIDTIQAGVSLTLVANLTNDHNAADTFLQRMVFRVAGLGSSSTVSNVDTDNSQDVYYFTDGVNGIQKWEPAGNFYHEPLPGIATVDGGTTWPDVEGIGTITTDVKAKYLRVFEGFIVLAHMVEEGTTIPQKIRWSRLDNFESWVNETDGTGQAGVFTFESSDWIMGLYQLKRELLVYRERSIEAMSYLGEPNIFGFRRAETGTGLVAPKALVDFGDKHMFLGPDNIWEYNGVSLVAIGDPIKDAFYDDVHPTQLGNVWMFFIEERDEVWLSYSTTTDRVHDKAYVYNSIFRKWSGPRDVDGTGFGYYREQASLTWNGTSGTWDDSTAIWNSRVFLANAPINLMGNDDGLIFKLDEIGTKDGSTISKRYESKLTNLGINGKKRVQRVRLGMEESSSGTASVYLGWASSSGDSVTWVGPVTFNPTDNEDPYIFFDESAEYFKVRVDTDDRMNIRDVEIHFYPRTFR